MSNVRRTGIVLRSLAYAGCVDVRSLQGLLALECLASEVAGCAGLLGRGGCPLLLLRSRDAVLDGGDGLLHLVGGRHTDHLLRGVVGWIRMGLRTGNEMGIPKVV